MAETTVRNERTDPRVLSDLAVRASKGWYTKGGVGRSDMVILMPYLRMFPEIATLASRVLYRKNSFILQNKSRLWAYPPQPVNHNIRRLVVTHIVNARSLSAQEEFDRLKGVASGRYGFPNLRHLLILVEFKVLRMYFEDTVELQSETEFGCPGDWHYNWVPYMKEPFTTIRSREHAFSRPRHVVDRLRRLWKFKQPGSGASA